MQKKFIMPVLFFLSVGVLSACSERNMGNLMNERLPIGNQELNSETSKEINREVEEYVNAQVKVFEGSYIDERGLYDTGPAEESDLIYCYVMINEVTDNSFDFEINEVVLKTGEIENVVPESTAYFVEDGKKAVYDNTNEKLYFVFEDDQVNPIIGRMTIIGIEKLEGNIYINNEIPGHEAG